MSLHGVDLSNNNDAAHIASAIASKNNAFIIAKASEGEHTGDARHASIVKATRAAKKPLGHYHFAHPTQDAVTEAKHFLSAAGAQAGEVLALDLEASEGSWSQRLHYALKWLAYVKAQTKASPLLYTYTSYLTGLLGVASDAQKKELRSYPLWVADPNNPAGHPLTAGWKTWTVHQYGIVGGLDQNLLNGDLNTWKAVAIPAKVTQPAPPSVPSKPTPPTPPTAPTAPTPAKAYTMVIYGSGTDAMTAAAGTEAFQPKGAVATARLDVAQAALKAGDQVVAVGGPANKAIGFTHAKQGTVAISGKKIAVDGATAGDTYVLLGRYLATGK
jgi:GH25 family lysozyme M1 (1,4-beta-N-acetylmuramidase)